MKLILSTDNFIFFIFCVLTNHDCNYCSCFSLHTPFGVVLVKGAQGTAAAAILEAVILYLMKAGIYFMYFTKYSFSLLFGRPFVILGV